MKNDTTNTTYEWKLDQDTLVFQFTITPGNPPKSMTLSLSDTAQPSNVTTYTSTDGKILFSNVIVNNLPLTGEIWLDNSDSSYGFVEADLEYGNSPESEYFEGAMIEYSYSS